MTLYRMRRNTTKGNTQLKKGQIVSGDLFGVDATEKLLRVGAIARVASPPISEVYGWESRAKKLAAIGIVTAEDFLETDISKIVTQLRVSRATAQRLRHEIEQLLAPPPREGCEGCK